MILDILRQDRETGVSGSYIREVLGTSRQNARKHLVKLESDGLISPVWRDNNTKGSTAMSLIHGYRSIFYAITELGIEKYRLYRVFSVRKNNYSVISSYNSRSYFGSKRYHRHRVVVLLSKSVFANKYHKISKNMVVSNNTIIVNSSKVVRLESYSKKELARLDKKVSSYVRKNGLNVVCKKLLVDIAQKVRRKQALNESIMYKNFIVDNSEGYPEREATFELRNGEFVNFDILADSLLFVD